VVAGYAANLLTQDEARDALNLPPSDELADLPPAAAPAPPPLPEEVPTP